MQPRYSPFTILANDCAVISRHHHGAGEPAGTSGHRSRSDDLVQHARHRRRPRAERIGSRPTRRRCPTRYRGLRLSPLDLRRVRRHRQHVQWFEPGVAAACVKRRRPAHGLAAGRRSYRRPLSRTHHRQQHLANPQQGMGGLRGRAGQIRQCKRGKPIVGVADRDHSRRISEKVVAGSSAAEFSAAADRARRPLLRGPAAPSDAMQRTFAVPCPC